MLLDSNTILCDNVAVTDAAVTGEPVGLTSLMKPGRAEPIFVDLRVTEDFAGGTSITFTLQESDAADGTFTDVAGGSLEVETANLTTGRLMAFRFLPGAVSKPWLKLTATPTGTFTAGKIFAAITREDDLPYTEGMYIDAGIVKG